MLHDRRRGRLYGAHLFFDNSVEVAGEVDRTPRARLGARESRLGVFRRLNSLWVTPFALHAETRLDLGARRAIGPGRRVGPGPQGALLPRTFAGWEKTRSAPAGNCPFRLRRQ